MREAVKQLASLIVHKRRSQSLLSGITKESRVGLLVPA